MEKLRLLQINCLTNTRSKIYPKKLMNSCNSGSIATVKSLPSELLLPSLALAFSKLFVLVVPACT